MGLSVKLRHLPQRIAAGAFILNSGIGKLSADEETAAGLTPFPTQQGVPLAKDVWMAGIGIGLVLDDLTDR